VAQMVRMPLQDSERPIQLLEQHHARKFMGQGHVAQREHEIRLTSQLVAEAIRRANCKYQWHRVALLMAANELRQFLR